MSLLVPPTPVTGGGTGSIKLRVLSVQQPWADGLCLGWKPVENRTWQTPHRGQLWIHASKLARKPSRESLARQTGDDFVTLVHSLWDEPGNRQTGAIIGSVDLVDIVPWDWVDDLAAESDRIQGEGLILEIARRWATAGATPARIRRVWKQVEPWTKRHTDGHNAMFCGPLCWIVENPILLQNPIPCGGKLNLWTHNADRPPV